MTSTMTREVYDATIPRFDLRAWRTHRLGLMKQRPEYKGLPRACRDLVDYMVKRHDNPEHGMCPNQGGIQKGKTPPLSTRFGVSRKTINERLQKIVDSQVLTKTPRYCERGRMSNRYDLNDARLSPPAATLVTPAGVTASPRPTTEGYAPRYTPGYSGSSPHQDYTMEAPYRRTHEALSTFEQRDGEKTSSPEGGSDDKNAAVVQVRLPFTASVASSKTVECFECGASLPFPWKGPSIALGRHTAPLCDACDGRKRSEVNW